MQPEYLKYWGLEKAPFSLTPDPDMLYLSKQHQEGLIRLRYSVISNKGGALLVSENAGDGKTSLLARLSRDLEEQYLGGCRVVFIDHPTLTANQMVVEITRQLGVATSSTDKLSLLNELRQFLLESHRQEIKCVVILDEGQMLCNRPDLLQELRILLNFCISDAFLLTFILSGQRPLDETLRAMPEFYQRLPVRFFLKNMDRNDTREMIRHRLHLAGNPVDREIFSEDGYTGIYNYSKGCPRIICSIADLALVIAHSRYSEQVDFVSVSQACSDMSRTDGGYHYYYFLDSFKEKNGSKTGELSSAPGKPRGGKLCTNCGKEVLSEVKFCPECGESLTAAPVPDVPEEKPAAVPDSVSKEEAVEKAKEKEAPADQEAEKKTGEVKSKAEDHKGTKVTQLDFEPQKTEPQEPEDDSSREHRLPEAEEISAASATLSDESQTELTKTGEDQPEKQAGDIGSPLDSEVPEGKIKCPFCGLILDREIDNCPNCGEPLKETEPDEKSEAEPEVPAAGVIDQDPVVDGDSTGQETPVQEEAEIIPTRVCPHCGEESRVAGPLCDSCGSPLESKSYEQVLLERLEELSLRKFILSKGFLREQRPPDPKDEELLFIPMNRFLGSSAILRYTDSGSEDSFTTRCGLILTSSKIRFVFAAGTRDLPYEDIEAISVEKLEKNGVVVVYQLVLSTTAGQYRISLPYRLLVAGRISNLLEQYLSAKVKAVAYVKASRVPEAGISESAEGNHAGGNGDVGA